MLVSFRVVIVPLPPPLVAFRRLVGRSLVPPSRPTRRLRRLVQRRVESDGGPWE